MKKPYKNKAWLQEQLENKTFGEIAAISEVSLTTIKRYARRFKLKANKKNTQRVNSEKHRKWKLNEHYFSQINSCEKAYLLGLLAADGWVSAHGNTIGLTLAKKDIGAVEHFLSAIGSNKPVKLIQKTINNQIYEYAEATVQNYIMYQDLVNLGIVDNKSLTLDIGKIATKANCTGEKENCLLLGYFDGDGSLGHGLLYGKKKYYWLTITGTKETCLYFKQFFDNHGSLSKRHKDNKNNYTLSFSNNYSTIYKAAAKLYSSKDFLPFYFSRKHNLFLQLQNEKSLQGANLEVQELNHIAHGCGNDD